MNCARCGVANTAEHRFCAQCGAALSLLCPSCGFSNGPNAKFCGGCGSRLSAAAAIPGAKFGSPDTYTPKHLAEKIRISKHALEGERKHVTVLFADLKGSMELLADRDPEEAQKLLDPVLEHLMEAVHRYEGTVNQVMGDGIMALFGAPLAHEDHAVRACYAALAMQAAIRRYTEEVRRAQGIEVQIRVGLNSGEVVVRAIGNDLHMDYSAIGQTTHLAARMEQLAAPGSIRLTADTLRLAEGFVEVHALGPVPVRGLADPVEVFELVGAGPTPRRFEAATARGLTRFVGREGELDALREALEEAGSAHGHIVALVGEPGVGKSRLFWEFTHSHRTEGWLVLYSGSVSYGKATPYLPVIDLLKAYFQIGNQDDHRKIREKIVEKVLALDDALKPALPAFFTLLDVPVEDPQWQGLDPPQRRQRTLDAVRHLLLRESRVQPVLLTFEDLHWIDTETQALLDRLVESVPMARLLLLVSYRPEYQHGWGNKTCYTQLRLDPLAPDSAEEFLEGLLGSDTSLSPLKRLLIERTEGNPFFLEESVRTLVETQLLAGKRGAHRLAKTLPSIQVPATVQAVLAARIDRLPLEEKRLLQSAAVIGRHVPFVLLQAIAELPEPQLRRGLGHLQSAEFLYETSLFPDVEYTFKHALTHEVAYGSLLEDRRRALHGRIVDAIERLYPNRLAEHVERLADHTFRGEVWDKAVTYLRHAGAKAALRSVHREAATYFQQALAALTHLPQSRDTLEQAIDLRFDLRTALIPLGEYARIFDYLQEAETVATTLDDPRRLGRVCVYVTSYFREIGEYDRAIDSGRRALSIAEAMGDLALQVPANHFLGQVCHDQGRYRQGSQFLRRNVKALAGDLSHERLGLPYVPSVHSRTWLVRCLAQLGEFAEGIAIGEAGVRIAESVDHPFSLTSAHWGLGGLYLGRGDLDRAIRVLERGFDLGRAWSIRILLPALASELGSAYALSGRLPRAVPLLEQAVEQHASIRGTVGLSTRLSALSQAYLLVGRFDDAATHARRALTLALDHKEQGNQAHALHLLGAIAANTDATDGPRAEVSCLQALALSQELEMQPLTAQCHRTLGMVYRRSGDSTKAMEHSSAAHALFSQMDMPFWLNQSEAGFSA